MKNIQLLSCVLFTSIALHGMEERLQRLANANALLEVQQNNQLIPQKQENNTWETIDCSVAAKTLKTDGDNDLKTRLEEYKKADFAPKDMEHINSMCLQITGKPDRLIYNNGYGIEDDQKNGFLHIAVRKADLAIVTWLLNNKCW